MVRFCAKRGFRVKRVILSVNCGDKTRVKIVRRPVKHTIWYNTYLLRIQRPRRAEFGQNNPCGVLLRAFRNVSDADEIRASESVK